jgi:hypothetical protein
MEEKMRPGLIKGFVDLIPWLLFFGGLYFSIYIIHNILA